jgi:hypothetical protein
MISDLCAFTQRSYVAIVRSAPLSWEVSLRCHSGNLVGLDGIFGTEALCIEVRLLAGKEGLRGESKSRYRLSPAARDKHVEVIGVSALQDRSEIARQVVLIDNC